MTDRLLVARVASASSPDREWEVKTDGTFLSCPCPGWTRQVHTHDCRAHSGGGCDCKHRSDVVRESRTCRHTRYVEGLVAQRGGLWAVYQNLRAGRSALDSRVDESAVTRRHALDEFRALGWQFCNRVVVNEHGDGVPASGTGTVNRPAVVYVRADGWTLGAPLRFAEVARRLWHRDWVGQLDLATGTMSSYSGQPFAPVTVRGPIPRQRSTRPRTRTAAVAPPPQPPAAPPAPAGTVDWLGGARAIILRD